MNRPLTVPEASRLACLSARRFRELCRTGSVPEARKQGRDWLIYPRMGIFTIVALGRSVAERRVRVA